MTDDLRKLAEAVRKVAPGPWGSDSEKMTDAPYQHHEYVLFDANGNRLLDTANSGAGFGLIEEEHDEDGHRAWNEPARVLMKYLVAAQPDAILNLVRERDEARADFEQAADWNKIVDEAGLDRFDEIADKWLEMDAIQRLHNAVTSVFAKWSNDQIMARFKEHMTNVMHQSFVEGAICGVRASKARAEAAEASLSEKEREVEKLRAEIRVEREITENLSWAGEQNNRTVAALRWELGLAVANLEAAASAYRTYAKRHLSIVPKATTDAAFTTRVADFDKAVERARAALTPEPSHD